MDLWIGEQSIDIANHAADQIEALIRQKPDAVLGLATGSTPIATYQELIRRYRAGRLDFSRVRTFNLDEYYGLPQDHPQSYYHFMMEQLFRHINIRMENIHIPSGTPLQVNEYCEQYEDMIGEYGGVDLQLLGIGKNGHIGFNEPAKELAPHTHLVQLSDATIEANSRFFTNRNEVPQYAITMGMKTILAAKRIILIAESSEKAAIIQKLFDSGISTELPASFLRLHANVTVMVDQQAASLFSQDIKG